MHRRAFLGTALTAAVLVTALHAPAAADDWKSKVDTIRFGILSSENEKDHTQRYSAFKAYLEKNLGVEIESHACGLRYPRRPAAATGRAGTGGGPIMRLVRYCWPIARMLLHVQ